MKLTNADIESARSARGGWTRRQLAEWGVPWPPPKGWKRALIRGEPVGAPESANILSLIYPGRPLPDQILFNGAIYEPARDQLMDEQE